MAGYYLAVDIGASSGRHILGHLEQGKMVQEIAELTGMEQTEPVWQKMDQWKRLRKMQWMIFQKMIH